MIERLRDWAIERSSARRGVLGLKSPNRQITKSPNFLVILRGVCVRDKRTRTQRRISAFFARTTTAEGNSPDAARTRPQIWRTNKSRTRLASPTELSTEYRVLGAGSSVPPTVHVCEHGRSWAFCGIINGICYKNRLRASVQSFTLGLIRKLIRKSIDPLLYCWYGFG